VQLVGSQYPLLPVRLDEVARAVAQFVVVLSQSVAQHACIRW
jgi:hypothetical protein